VYEITLKQIKEAIKAKYKSSSYKALDDHVRKNCKSDELLAKFGPLTAEIACHLGKDQAKTRYWLNKFCKYGHVYKSSTKGGSCRWWYEGLLSELKSEIESDQR